MAHQWYVVCNMTRYQTIYHRGQQKGKRLFAQAIVWVKHRCRLINEFVCILIILQHWNFESNRFVCYLDRFEYNRLQAIQF